ncbi:MAG: NfeD family protein [Lachnospiraceae bacterium]|nr:NfeD family protein [Lachnospiraceae bacterium]
MPDTILLIWLVSVAVFLVIEILTLGLTTIWFAGGALVAFLAGICGANIAIQFILFFVVSFVMLLGVRPSACRKFNSKRIKTNVESLIGTECKVLEQIDNFNQKGTVLLDGKEWTARSIEDRILEVGERVQVVKISGVKVYVTKMMTEQPQNKKEEV